MKFNLRRYNQGELSEHDVDIQRWEQAEAMPPIPSDPKSLASFFAVTQCEGEGEEGRRIGGKEEGATKEWSDGALIAQMVEEVGRGSDCSPRRRMPYDSINEGSKCVSMTWRATPGRP